MPLIHRWWWLSRKYVENTTNVFGCHCQSLRETFKKGSLYCFTIGSTTQRHYLFDVVNLGLGERPFLFSNFCLKSYIWHTGGYIQWVWVWLERCWKFESLGSAIMVGVGTTMKGVMVRSYLARLRDYFVPFLGWHDWCQGNKYVKCRNPSCIVQPPNVICAPSTEPNQKHKGYSKPFRSTNPTTTSILYHPSVFSKAVVLMDE